MMTRRVALQGLMAGAGALSIATHGFQPLTTATASTGGGRYYVPPAFRERFRHDRGAEDDLLMALMLASMPGLLRRH